MKLQVLITSPRGKEHLVQAFEEAGACVVRHLTYANLIIPTVDEEFPFFSNNTEFFACLDKKIMIASEWTINTCRDKAEFYRFCRRHEFKTFDTMQTGLVAKPRFGKGGRGLIKIDQSYIVQPDYSAWPEVSIDYFADWDGKPLSVIPRYRKNVVNGESKEADFNVEFNNTHKNQIEEIKRLGKELGLIGHNVIQGFLVYGEMVFTEVNPRFGGGSWLTFHKFHSPRWLTENINARVCGR